MRASLLLLISILWACSSNTSEKPVIEEVALERTVDLGVPEKLSAWGLFNGPMNELQPAEGVLPYDLNTPLFSDYAFKARFVKVPEGKVAGYDPKDVIDFPEGTILIKNFYYPADFRLPEGERRIIETRLLVLEPAGWNAWTYVWNEEQTEAILEIAGAAVPVSWQDREGVLQSVSYSVPNLVQCKSCHDKSGKMTLIGPTARQLNRTFAYGDGVSNQLKKWESLGMLSALPPMEEWPVVPDWNDERTGTLDQRARAWLEINCAHCHRLEGPAKNTGLYLTWDETDLYKLGVNKPPVAAGRGSGGLKYGIVPGRPEASILVHRIESLDPGVMMPELGRKMVHLEGVEVVKAWIRNMDAKK